MRQDADGDIVLDSNEEPQREGGDELVILDPSHVSGAIVCYSVASSIHHGIF